MQGYKKLLVVAFLGVAALGISAPEAVAQERSLFTTQALWAVVSTSGNIARGAGAVSAVSFGSGFYEVLFNRDVSNCIYSTTIGVAGAGVANAGQITAVRRSGNNNGVFIATTDSQGFAVNRPFHLEVDCE